MKTKTYTFFITLMLITQLCFTQEKYAIILNAYAPDTFYSENSWADANPTSELFYEFWNDVYLMWEMLYERGFEDENISSTNWAKILRLFTNLLFRMDYTGLTFLPSHIKMECMFVYLK